VHFQNGFFVQTMAGFGVFKLRGKYKEEYNKKINANIQPGEQVVNANYLPKGILSINLGFQF
jgi:hypothetical protein